MLGGWEFDGVGRIQSGELIDFGNVRLVGMTRGSQNVRKSSRAARRRRRPAVHPAAGHHRQHDQGVQTSATSATGYGALGAPTGRYLAPANGPDCIETSQGAGDCGIRSLVVNAPRLVRFDLSTVKRVKIHGDVELRVPRRDAERVQQHQLHRGGPDGNSATINQITAAQRDVNNTQNPGGRLLQFVFRLTF